MLQPVAYTFPLLTREYIDSVTFANTKLIYNVGKPQQPTKPLFDTPASPAGFPVANTLDVQTHIRRGTARWLRRHPCPIWNHNESCVNSRPSNWNLDARIDPANTCLRSVVPQLQQKMKWSRRRRRCASSCTRWCTFILLVLMGLFWTLRSVY